MKLTVTDTTANTAYKSFKAAYAGICKTGQFEYLESILERPDLTADDLFFKLPTDSVRNHFVLHVLIDERAKSYILDILKKVFERNFLAVDHVFKNDSPLIFFALQSGNTAACEYIFSKGARITDTRGKLLRNDSHGHSVTFYVHNNLRNVFAQKVIELDITDLDLLKWAVNNEQTDIIDNFITKHPTEIATDTEKNTSSIVTIKTKSFNDPTPTTTHCTKVTVTTTVSHVSAGILLKRVTREVTQ